MIKGVKGKSTYLFFAIAILIAMGFLMFFFMFRGESEEYIARVGDSIVKPYEFEFFLSMEKTYLEQLAGVYGDEELRQEFWNSKMSGEDPLDVAKERALEAIREYKIYEIKARENGIRLDEEEELKVIQVVEEKMRELGNDSMGIMQTQTEDSDMFLQEYGVSSDDYKKILRQMEIIRKFDALLDDMEKAQKDALLRKWSEDPQYELVLNRQMID